MTYQFDARAEARLETYVSEMGGSLGDIRRQASFAAYVGGLMGTTDRKSMEPMAAVASGDEKRCSGAHQRIQHFISDSEWDDQAIRLAAARHAITAMERHEPISTWIVDDTGFLKQGKHSVGVQRQYTGSAGKTANCQIGVSLSVATSRAHVPIDFELFLPVDWADDAERRAKAKVPEDVTFRSKEDLALEMIERAARAKIPGNTVLADSWYGRSSTFRDTVQLLGFDFALGIPKSQTMWRLNARDEVAEQGRHSAESVAQKLAPRRFREVTWRQGVSRGPRGAMRSRFAFVRVAVPSDADPSDIAKLWLLIEWPEGEKEPTRYALTTLPRRMPKKEIIRLLKERYRTEQVYEEMKGNLGLDHFEGRSFRGWHHHVTVALVCYAFIKSELIHAFPPSAVRTRRAHPLGAAA